MTLQLVCNHCLVPGEFMYSLGHASLHGGRLYEDAYDEAPIHLHWECIVPWWTATEEARKNAEEVPF